MLTGISKSFGVKLPTDGIRGAEAPLINSNANLHQSGPIGKLIALSMVLESSTTEPSARASQRTFETPPDIELSA